MKRRPGPETGPLAGVRILDLSSVVLGPFATMALGDLGAEIIKVERPEGDSARWVNRGRNPGMSGTTMNLNRNKRSIVLDLRMPTAREAVLRLAAGAEVFFHKGLIYISAEAPMYPFHVSPECLTATLLHVQLRQCPTPICCGPHSGPRSVHDRMPCT